MSNNTFDNSLSINSLACCCISTAVVVAMKVVFTGLLAYFIIEKQVRAYIVSPKVCMFTLSTDMGKYGRGMSICNTWDEFLHSRELLFLYCKHAREMFLSFSHFTKYPCAHRLVQVIIQFFWATVRISLAPKQRHTGLEMSAFLNQGKYVPTWIRVWGEGGCTSAQTPG